MQEIDDVIKSHVQSWEKYADEVNELVNNSTISVNKAIKLVMVRYPNLLPN